MDLFENDECVLCDHEQGLHEHKGEGVYACYDCPPGSTCSREAAAAIPRLFEGGKCPLCGCSDGDHERIAPGVYSCDGCEDGNPDDPSAWCRAAAA